MAMLEYRPRANGKRFEQFNELIKWATEGKTFIFMHPDMVAIDMKTWKDIDKILHPPAKIVTYYDEYDEITPEKEKILNDYFKKRLK